MRIEDLELLLQSIESMSQASQDLEKAINKGDAKEIKKLESEILNFQKQIGRIIG
jgi:peptidoglycan hydrolase CwlO-like protein